MTGLRGLDYR